MNLIRKQGNRAVHGATPVQDSDSLSVVRELFHVLIWLATTGMDRSAATDALSAFAADVNLTGIQHAFVDLVIDQLTTRGSVSIELLYEAPFTDYAPMGPDGLFVEAQVTQLVSALDRVAATATAEAS
jgi:type I restriction enzyme R subunit